MLSWRLILRILLDAAEAMSFLHVRGFLIFFFYNFSILQYSFKKYFMVLTCIENNVIFF